MKIGGDIIIFKRKYGYYTSYERYKKKRLRKILFIIIFSLSSIVTIKYYYKDNTIDIIEKPHEKDNIIAQEKEKEKDEEKDLEKQMAHLSSDAQVKLKNLSQTDHKVKKIIENIDEYPMEIIEMLIKNPETTDFVLNYPEKKDNHEESIVASTQNVHGVPDFKQWDQRWGYEKYGDNIIGLCGCGPTSLSMVVVGLTGDNSITPKTVAQYSESRGYYFNGKGTSWDLMTKGCKKYGITSREVSLTEKSMVRELQSGRLIICSMSAGDFTTDGHFIVIHDYEDGKFIVNDPNSIKLSARRWSYSELEGQINNLWSFSKMK